ncbi:MAG TPA: HD domain-containing phosphohydrolase [Gemmatimonadaceae bacterium]|jgi:putative nucleotidyltransferase with HDIG domain|nr:HD domain-containing phosphohydrolase [Gemmatimonadaceae bacterium]
MTKSRPTIELKAVESSTVRESIDRAKHAEREGRWAEACSEYESLVRDPAANAGTRLAALRWLGRGYLEQGNRGAALDVLEAAVTSADIVGSDAAVAQALNVIGIVYQVGGDLDQAGTIYEAARAKAELAGDGALIAMIDQNLGTVAMIRGDLRAALEAFRLSHLGYQTLAMRNHEAQVLNNIALAYMELGELGDAETAYNQAALAFEEEGDHARQLDLAVNKVQLYIAGKRFDEALVQCEKLLAVSGSDSAPWRGEVFRHLGVIARERGDFPGATDHLVKAERHAIDSGDLLLRADVSEQLAEVYWAQKRHRDMLQNLNEAHSLYSQLKAQHRVAQVEKRNGALEARFLEIAKQWGDSIEGKDRYTQGHCERVAFFASVLADSAGFNARSLFWFRIGALLHDIGKIIVPTEVLNKPGKLTDEEWVVMKRHPEAGLELVADIDFPGDISAIIRNHHERWDGTGYPDGLKGEEIPFAARILCVADVYDALTTTRSYRPGLTHARAAEIMRSSAGQFDPQLLETFLDWAETADIPGRPTPQRLAIFASSISD